jgi:hypothetical protein
MSAGADRSIRWTTIGCVALLALIAGTVSLVARHGVDQVLSGSAGSSEHRSRAFCWLERVGPPKITDATRQ